MSVGLFDIAWKYMKMRSIKFTVEIIKIVWNSADLWWHNPGMMIMLFMKIWVPIKDGLDDVKADEDMDEDG